MQGSTTAWTDNGVIEEHRNKASMNFMTDSISYDWSFLADTSIQNWI